MQMTDIVNRRKMRHAHMVNINKQIMLEGMRADYNKVDAISRKAMEIVTKAKEIRATNPAGSDFTAKLTAELRAHLFNYNSLWGIRDGTTKAVRIFVPVSPLAAASAFASASTCSNLSEFSFSSRSNARSRPSGVGCTYRCDTVTLLCPAILMIVNASAPASPRRVNMVCLNECITKSADSFRALRTSSCG